MRCSKAQILLSASIDGEIEERDALALEQHVEACAECARLSESFGALHEQMGLWADEEPSPWLAQSFSYKLAEFQQERASAPSTAARRLRWAWGAASAGFASAVVAIGLFMHTRAVPPPTPVDSPVQVAVNMEKPAPAPVVKPSSASAPDDITAGSKPSPPRAPRTYVRTAGRPAQAGRRTNWRPRRPYLVAMSDTSSSRRSVSRAEAGISDRDGEALRLAKAGVHLELTLAKAVGEDPGGQLARNLGDAHHRMNESTERIRGTLQKAADLMASRPDVPPTGMADSVEGSIQ